jgi:hypothetical protein
MHHDIERLTPPGWRQCCIDTLQLYWGDKLVRTYFGQSGEPFFLQGCTFLAAVWYWGAAVLLPDSPSRPSGALESPLSHS